MIIALQAIKNNAFLAEKFAKTGKNDDRSLSCTFLPWFVVKCSCKERKFKQYRGGPVINSRLRRDSKNKRTEFPLF